MGLRRETGLPGGEGGTDISCRGRTTASPGGVEASTSARRWQSSCVIYYSCCCSAGHAPSRIEAAHNSRTRRKDSGRGHLLRGFAHNKEEWFRAVGSGSLVTSVADNGREEGLLFTSSLFGKKRLRSSSQAAVVRKNLDCRERSHGRVPTGGETHAMVTRRGVRIPVAECSRRRESERTGVAAKQTTTKTSRNIYLRAAGMEEIMRDTMRSFRVGGVAIHTMEQYAHEHC